MHKRIFIIAGEPSGDYLGSNLIKDIKDLTNNKVDIKGIGGELMQKAGLQLFFDMQEICLIGVAEVIPQIVKIKKKISQTVEEILKFDPDVIITIDSSGFTHRVNKKLKKKNKDIPIIHYVAPPVWAWRPWRARSMHKFIDLLLTLFPFEPKYFEKYGLRSVFVGHPISKDPNLIEPTRDEKQRFERKYSMASANLNICFLPGSRDSEISRHIAIFNDTMKILTKRYDKINVSIPTLESKVALVEKLVKGYVPHIITDRREKTLAMYSANIAVAASGSVNLELAITKTPTIVIYKTSSITAFVVRLLIKVNMVNIVNILLKDKVVPELLQENCTPENIAQSIESMISSRDCLVQKDACKKVIELIKEPEKMFAAKEVLNLICERRNKC